MGWIPLLRVSELAGKYRMTKKDLAEKSGIRYNTILDYYKDDWVSVKRDHLKSLARVFDCSVQDLFDE
ncbi:helix-turn-helix domain-containing protein [Kroppenstedtia sanguinis]|uniref:helix-turn-helix domain-containing protein n=1 Tax=Kroppenstedtia sanguinis TaxID=1380684 RepID=UPI0036D28135